MKLDLFWEGFQAETKINFIFDVNSQMIQPSNLTKLD